MANSLIFKNTNNFKIISQNSQTILDKKSNTFKIIDGNVDYSRLVKFIIIDKSLNTFLTNDVNSMQILNDKINAFSMENSELFNYISDKAIWYNISYNHESSPMFKTNRDNTQIENSNNFVEAYWFPKNYSYKREDSILIKNILKNYENKYNTTINNMQKNLNTKQYLIGLYSFLIILLLVALYFIGKENVFNGLKSSFTIRLFNSINIWFETRNTLFKLVIFIISTFPMILFIKKLLSYDPSYLLYIFNFTSTSIKKIYVFCMVIYILLYISIMVPKLIKFCKYIDEIIKGTNKITSGDLDFTIKERGDKSLLILAQNINKINKGFKISIDDQIKNEKLKSELVTNISHDLKTPLTSIINYTDILLKEDISEDEKEEFLKILNRKSLKLKTLIEDLFKISKINSGRVQLNKQEVNIVELLDQSIAEYSDTEIYKNKNLTFVTKTFSPEIKINLDGNEMSRVFENLINNSLKYSLRNTRIHVKIESIPKGIKIFFKNISCIPLDFDKKEIFERFTRGDKSRNSDIDGSGLGLAIAKSIIELHEGIMYIDFDGDLFKVIIELYY
ncbi:HAMP domain-containing sensor histidine kinase [Clostridium sp. Marseille-Q2269]|uniref:sensor histidine kinase n=1 Tax=Clostridium sp. Marseille-Q2269 TaxID=2942205 RepID=UPI0020735370|nr:HAMP domain-containing sensor histidine kinase [Clostridium sp. Marseille-Q2269]